MTPFTEKTLHIVSSAAALLSERGVRAHLVGGAVRDGLLGRTTSDVDIVLDGDAHQAAVAIADSLDGGVVSLDTDRDIARVVVETGSPGVVIDLARMTGGSLDADLRRRDFTMDAIAADLTSAVAGQWDLIDPLNGIADVEAGVVRAVSDGVFKDDPVRLLRAARLAAETGFRIEAHTKFLIRRDAALLTQSAPERVREELFRTLAAPGTRRSVEMMDDLGLLSIVIPELEDAKGVDQPKEHYYDVFGHLAAAAGHADHILNWSFDSDFVGEMMPTFDGFASHFAEEAVDGHTRGTLLKLTALLHDIAKPQTKTIEPTGRIRFFGHSEKGEEVVGGILRRLRVGRRGVRMARRMVRYHLRPGQMAAKGELPTSRAIHRFYRDLGDVALDTLYLSMADFLAAIGPRLTPEKLAEHAMVIRHTIAVGPQKQVVRDPASLLLTGHDIMNELQLEPGPLVGEVLGVVSKAEARGRVATKTEALELARTYLKSGGGGG